ncbi:MAG TPA: phosphotransferase [Pilimelia sp.]|nr:phosphotransferase [Pilimelia sp.]
MRAISLPAVPYDATAQRPDWAALPTDLRTAIEARLGAPVTSATTAGGGFTRGFAAVLTTAGGDRAFVKAAALDTQPDLADWYGRETVITASLPERVPAARPRWAATIAGHFVVCFDAIDGHMPELPWRSEELDAALAAWAVAADELRVPPPYLAALDLPRLTDLLRSDLSYWKGILAGRESMPPAPPQAAARLRELAALEATLPGYADTPGVIHCDLRLDNVLIDSHGEAWICDWNWLCYGPAWFDTAALLITAYASGLDADARFAAHPTAAGAPDDALDAALAAFAGFYLSRAAGEQTLASPHVRTHQLWSGEQALAWLAERQGWR